jgi:hypothetical protein
MPKGIMYVESRPVTAERLAEHHAWYNDTHLRQVVGVDGIVSARRFAPVGDDGPFVAIYEIEADDLQRHHGSARGNHARRRVDVRGHAAGPAADGPPAGRDRRPRVSGEKLTHLLVSVDQP